MSKKRAERLTKFNSKVEAVPSRLLKSALQGAVFKTTKRKSDTENNGKKTELKCAQEESFPLLDSGRVFFVPKRRVFIYNGFKCNCSACEGIINELD